MQIEDVRNPSDTLLDEIDELLMRAYGMSSRRSRVQRFLTIDHGGWVNLRNHDRLVAVGGYIGYPTGGFGWVGLVATDPGAERNGFGRIVTQAIVDRLAAIGCASVLDGSVKGAPVYERMGFVDHGHSRIYSAVGEPRPVPQESESSRFSTIEDVGPETVCAYDRKAFGADRSALLRSLVDSYAGRNVVRLAEDGRVSGYGIAQDDAIGPVVADEVVFGASIVESLRHLRWEAPPRIILPPGSPFGIAVESLGFELQRSLRRQHLGIDELPGRREFICAQTSFGEG
jgi:GNAT superfamily N-acetyltransferase